SASNSVVISGGGTQLSPTTKFTKGQTTSTYKVTVTNGGQAATSGTVTLTDTLPTGATATSISGTGWTCALDTLVCTRNDALAPGSSYPAITLTAIGVANAAASVTNSVTVSGGGELITTNDNGNDTTNIYPLPDLTV